MRYHILYAIQFEEKPSAAAPGGKEGPWPDIPNRESNKLKKGYLSNILQANRC